MFDETVANTDRKANGGNNMVVRVSDASPQFKYVAIDHGHALTGPRWTPDTLRAYPKAPIVPVFSFVETCLTSEQRLVQEAARVASKVAEFGAIVSGSGCDLEASDRAAVVSFLGDRAGDLPNWVVGDAYRKALTALRP